MWAYAKCRRCRHKWDEFLGSAASNGDGCRLFCPRCLCGKIDRTYERGPGEEHVTLPRSTRRSSKKAKKKTRV